MIISTDRDIDCYLHVHLDHQPVHHVHDLQPLHNQTNHCHCVTDIITLTVDGMATNGCILMVVIT